MNDTQRIVIDQTIRTVRIIEPKKILVNTLIYSGLGLALIYFVTQSIDVFTAVYILVFALLYSFIKDYAMLNQTKKIIRSHFNYILEKKPGAELYTPMMERTGRGLLLKRASLFFVQDKLFLEAFRQQAFQTKPKESITIPYGKDFVITDLYPESKRNIVICKGVLMNAPYEFVIVNHPLLIDRIQSTVDNSYKKEV